MNVFLNSRSSYFFLQQGLLETEILGDLVYKLKKNISRAYVSYLY